MAQRLLTHSLRRKQLDRQFASMPELRRLIRPRKGWIRELRDALGMSAAQLARRLNVRQSSVAKLERSEAEETISLRSLHKVADALNCDLVYSLIPRSSLEATLQQQALRRAVQLVEHIEHTMALEAQNRSQEAKNEAVRELAAELARTLRRDLWEETP